MIKRSILSVLALCASAAPVQANMYRMVSTSDLARAVEATGTRIVYDTEKCDDFIYGYYKLEHDNKGNIFTDELGICVQNHGDNYQELGDTLRHEAMHVAQACHGGAILPVKDLLPYVDSRISRLLSTYSKEDYHVELEAFVSAKMLGNSDVVSIVNRMCTK